MAFSSSGNAPNFAPIANIKAERDEVFLGQAISFSGKESIDPDDGPKRLSFFWDFGDGATSTNANPSQTYGSAAAYRVTLTISDGIDAAMETAIVHVLAPVTARPPTRSSLLALNPAQTEVWVVNPDSASVSVLAVRAGEAR